MADAEILSQVELALANAKRAQRDSRLVVQTLARLRDNLQPEEAQGNEHHDRYTADS